MAKVGEKERAEPCHLSQQPPFDVGLYIRPKGIVSTVFIYKDIFRRAKLLCIEELLDVP